MNQEKKPTNAEPDEQPPVPERRAEPKETSSARRPLIYLITIVVIFLLGFIPMWFKAANREKERDTARRELRLAQIHLALASAAIDARRGEYSQPGSSPSTSSPVLQRKSITATTLRSSLRNAKPLSRCSNNATTSSRCWLGATPLPPSVCRASTSTSVTLWRNSASWSARRA